jgi:hypothetical protein
VFGRRGTAFALALLLLVVLALHVVGLGGDFLSDDFSHLSVIAKNDAQGTLGDWLVERFLNGLDNGNFAFRPLAFASYALDWRAYGANATGWHLTNLALYFVNALAAATLVGRWLRDAPGRAPGALTAAAAMVAFPFAGEISFWPVGRFDLLAALFSVLYLHALPPAARARPINHAWRVVWLWCALLSKESAIPLPLIASLVCLCAVSTQGTDTLRARIRFAVRETASTWIAFALYLAWRAKLFGSIWKVYPSSSPPHDLAEWLDRVLSVRHVIAANVSSATAWSAIAGALVVAMAAIALAQRQRLPRDISLLGLVLLFCAAMYALAPTFSFPLAPANGDGGRHLYLAWVYASFTLALAAAASCASQWAVVALLVVTVFSEAQSLGKWQAAAREMRRITSRIAAFAERVPRGSYALLYLPDHVGAVLFARNAQGGIVQPPRQPADYLGRMAVMTEEGFDEWSGRLSRMAEPGNAYPANIDGIDKAALYCWNPRSDSIVPLTSGAASRNAAQWRREVAVKVQSAGCFGAL